ncbi:MAG: TIGR03618 family F420-dependent PPOX class oxidoreductase, partial [Nocardioidaceae bacterium]
SNVIYTWDEASRTIRISLTADRAKTYNLRRDPRASFHVDAKGGWSYVVAEGIADLSPVAAEPTDATVDELVEIYRAISGEHPDWDEFRAAMVQERRLVLRLPVDRVYGLAR